MATPLQCAGTKRLRILAREAEEDSPPNLLLRSHAEGSRAQSLALSGEGRGHVLAEFLRGRKANEAKILALDAVRAEERNRRRPENAEALQECLIGCVVRRHIRLQQHDVREPRLHLRIR